MGSIRRYGRLLVRYLRPQLRPVLMLALLLGGGIGLQLISPQLVRQFLDAAASNRGQDELLRTATLFVTLASLAQLLRVGGVYVGENVAWRATNALRADLALHCLRLDMSFHKQHKPGELIERVDGDVNKLASFFSQLVIGLASNLLLMAGVMVLLWLLDWRVGLTMSLVLGAGLFILNRFNKLVIPRWQRLREVEATLFGYLEEWLDGAVEIQTNRAAPFVMGRLYVQLRRRWRAMQQAMRINVFIILLPVTIPTLAYMAAYWWGDRLFENGVLSIGAVYLIFYYLDVVKGPLWDIQRHVQDLQQAAASMNRILDLLHQKLPQESGSAISLPQGPLAVDFTDVSFFYADEPNAPVLRDVNFSLQPGRVLGLLGRTGSGKTTLTRLLLRFHDVTAGAITLGTGHTLHDLRDIARPTLRSEVGVVSQEVELFHATVRDNLTLFDDAISDREIEEALGALGLLQWLASLPAGLDTRLEAGSNLSAGEAQLLAVGRVFLSGARLVILDEASSRLDPATGALLEKALQKLLSGRTAIIIAHKLSTVRRVDDILILEAGRVAEHGTRAALAADPNSRFSRLLQLGLEGALAA